LTIDYFKPKAYCTGSVRLGSEQSKS